MTDELRRRMRDLARQSEHTSAPGLADVLHRRDRRQRNTVLASTLAVVAVLGSTALFLNPFGDNPSIQPLGPGTTVTSEATTTLPVPLPTTDAGQPTTDPAQSTTDPTPATGGGQTGQTGGQTSALPSGNGESTASTPTDTPDPILAIDYNSLATQEELDAAGVPVGTGNEGDVDGQPTLPPMCTASSWQEQYSGPDDFVSGSYSLGFGMLHIDLLSYPSAAEANLALVKLKEDARACPVVNEFLSVEVTAVGSAIGDEFVIFRMDSEDGDSGDVLPIWVTIARTDNVLVAAAVTEDHIGRDTSGNEQLTRDAAAANVEHLQAS